MSLLTLTICCCVLAATPMVLGLMSLAFYRTLPDALGPTETLASVLIPARNEAHQIEAAVRAVLASQNAGFEVVVLDDQSSDRRPEIVERLTREDARVRLISGTSLPAGWSGKPYAYHRLAGAARHPILIFIDADVRLAADALTRIAATVERDPTLALMSGVPRQDMGSFAERLAIPIIHFLLLGFPPIPMMRRCMEVGFDAGCGQFFAARADAYRMAGGHAAISESLHDGVKLPRAFRRSGLATDLYDVTDVARCRMYRGGREVWAGFMKNAHEGMATVRPLPIWTLLLAGGRVVPGLLFAWALVMGADALITTVAKAATGLGVTLRLVLALRFRQPLSSAVLHPLGIAVVLAIQWTALVRTWAGRPTTWRGRTYGNREIALMPAESHGR